MGKKSKVLKFLNNRSIRTQRAYAQTVSAYEKFHGTSIDELICEALDEQGKIAPHLLKAIDRIEDFQQYLISQGYLVGSILVMMGRIKTIYHKNRVELPYLEEINYKQINKREYIEYDDILKKEEIIKSLNHMRLPAQARAMVMIHGGLSNEECEQLRTRAFIDDLYHYHHKDDDLEALEWLADEYNPVIWVVRLLRKKTGKPYYAIISPEAVNKIAEAKIYESELPKNKGEIPEKLLDIHKTSFNKTCITVNKQLNLGLAGVIKHSETTDNDGNIYIRKRMFNRFKMITDIDYKVIKENDRVIISTQNPNTEIQFETGGQGRLRPHMLRKFHATHIKGSVLSYEERVISNSEIDEMQGRGKTQVQDTYIKTNPLEQKIIYAKVMNNLCLYHQYDYDIVDGDVVVWIKDPMKENEKLKKENEKLQKQMIEKKKASDKVQKLREELGDDAFKEMIGEILNAS